MVGADTEEVATKKWVNFGQKLPDAVQGWPPAMPPES